MPNKAFWLFIVLVFGCADDVFAQNITSSPYSIIGTGDIHFSGTPQQSAMGQTGQAVRKTANVNVLNPASYSALKYTVLDGGAFLSSGTFKQASNTSSVTNYSFSYFMMGLPLSYKKNIGMSFGLAPASSAGYTLTQTLVTPDFTAENPMTGSGGISKFHLGAGAQLFDRFSLGVNVNYLFGQLIREQKLLIPREYNAVNSALTQTIVIRDFQYDIGIQYHDTFQRGIRKDAYEFVAGVTVTPATDLSARETNFSRTLGFGGTLFTTDTVSYTNDKKGTIRMPLSIRTGISLEKKDQWQIATDVNFTQWSEYRRFGRTDSLRNSLGFGIGGSIIPNSMDYKNYFKRIEYRAGVRYNTGNLTLRDTYISSYAVAAGLGLPLGKSKSRLNVTFEYSTRGTTRNNLLQEDYFRIILGLNFSDRWFLRYKYD